MSLAEDEEVELKLLCDSADAEALMAAAPAGEDETRELVSVYFDTEDRALQKAGVSLRVRDGSGRHVQTLKRGEGLARREVEAEVPSFAPDPKMKALKPLLKAADDPALKPLFSVAVTRRQRLVQYAGATIEMAFDEGEVRAGRDVRPVHELELELKSGARPALFALALELGKAAPLYLSFETKSARGQRLAIGDELRGGAARLDKSATTQEAFQAIAGRALARMTAAAERVREAVAAEPVHQLRVAVRTLRSTLATHEAILNDGEDKRLAADLKWLAKSCDATRDLDVFLGETLAPADAGAPGLAELAETARAARETSAQTLLYAVSSQRFRDLALELARWLETGAWLDDPLTAKLRRKPARAFAADALARHRRRLLKKARGLAELEPEDRHKARIAAKKLRYAAEGAEALYPARRLESLIKPLKALQEALGQLNDIAAARSLVDHLAPPPEAKAAADRLLQARAQREADLLADAEQALKAIRRAELPD